MSESNLSFENTIEILREKGFTLVESTITVVKMGTDYTINSIKVCHPSGKHVEIYDRKQYATDSPNIGMFIEASGMCYGAKSGNVRVYHLSDILDSF